MVKNSSKLFITFDSSFSFVILPSLKSNVMGTVEEDQDLTERDVAVAMDYILLAFFVKLVFLQTIY